MPSDTPPPLSSRFFRACVLILGGVAALWLALELLSQFWGWILVVAGAALLLWCAIAVYRYWWGRR